MRDYIVEQSAGELLRNNFTIYFNNFLPLFFIYFVPIFPFQMMSMHGQLTGDATLYLIGQLIVLSISVFTVSAMTIAISAVCLGNKPRFSHAYQAIFNKNLINYVLTSLLVTITIVVGFLLFIIPGLFFLAWFMFALPIVILERKSAVQALKRSKELGKGLYLRNWGVLTLMGLVAGVFGAVIGGIISMAVAISGGEIWLLAFLLSVVTVLMVPATQIISVLLYYDMRVRKEAYDSTMLAQDLRR
jgi:hypothetical protein